MVEADKINRAGLPWPELTRGRLIKRYKRFLADVMLDDGTEVTAHCANSGRMTSCSDPGRPVFLSFHDNPRRKLKYSWELIEMPSSLVGVNTLVPNRLVARAARHDLPPALAGYSQVKPEVRIDDHTRLDLKLSAPGRRDCFVEIKNCTLVEDNVAMFPDVPTTRGQKHLQTLAALKDQGHRAVIFFLVQRTDAVRFSPAHAIDAEYGRLLQQVATHGVEILVFDVVIDLERIALGRALPLRLK
jgi:sugar fermentation stimulation protein A